MTFTRPSRSCPAARHVQRPGRARVTRPLLNGVSPDATSNAATLTVSPATVTFPIKLDCGTGTPVSGWQAGNAFVTGGNDYATLPTVDTSGVAGAAPADLYKTCRHLAHSYAIPVPNGTYTVILHLNDNGAGRRFIYTIEGVTLLDGYDPPDATATVQTFGSVTVSDGVVDIDASFVEGVDAFECGIEIHEGGTVVDADPTVAITSPSDGDTVSGSIDVTGASSDDNSVTDVDVSVDGGAFSSASGGVSSWSWSLDTTGLADGSHTITARATDTGGNTAEDSVTVTVDNGGSTDPWITIQRPAAGDVWYVGTTHTIEWTSGNLSEVVIYLSTDGTHWEVIDQLQMGPDWGARAWTVSFDGLSYAAPSTTCRLTIAGYFGEGETYSETFTIAEAVDADSDGMDDAWEIDVFGDTSHDGTADTDGDGLTDLDEFLGGTDPLVPDAAADEETYAFSCAAGNPAAPGSAAALAILVAAAALLLRARDVCRA